MSQENKQSVPANEEGSSSKDVKSPQRAEAGEDINQLGASCKVHAGVDVNHNCDRKTGAGGPRIATLPAGCQMIKLEGNSIFENLNYFATVLESGLDKTPPAHVPFSLVEMKEGDRIELIEMYEDV